MFGRVLRFTYAKSKLDSVSKATENQKEFVEGEIALTDKSGYFFPTTVPLEFLLVTHAFSTLKVRNGVKAVNISGLLTCADTEALNSTVPARSDSRLNNFIFDLSK